VSFRVHFEGALVIDSLLGVLEAGATSDDGQAVLPPLGAASRVVLAGSSGGAVGVLSHLDRVAERLPSAEVVGVLDAMAGPSSAHLTPAQQALKDASGERQWEEDFLPIYDALVDDSCQVDALEAWECVVPTALQFDHVQTPYFVQFDLRDSLLISVFESFGVTSAEFPGATAATLQDLIVARPDVGVRASTCSQHVYLGSDLWLHEQLLPVGGVDLSVHDALLTWLDGGLVAAVDDPVAPQSVCP